MSQNFLLKSCNFRPPKLLNDYRSPEIRYQNNLLWYFQFLFLPSESIQSHSPGQYSPYMERTPKFFGCGLTTQQITLTSLSCRQPIIRSRSRSVEQVCTLLNALLFKRCSWFIEGLGMSIGSAIFLTVVKCQQKQ